MNREIKKYADSGDLKSLKYIFVDALDVDPTFSRYEEEYNYCKSVPGLLEDYVELTPFTNDKAEWTENYWTNLKMDLLKNFSDKRMTHMREVAKVLLSDKIQRILNERAVAQNQHAPSTSVVASSSKSGIPKSPLAEKQLERKSAMAVGSKAAEQARQLEEARKKLAAENQAEAERRAAEEKKRLDARQKFQETQAAYEYRGASISKKAIGIAVAAVAVTAVVLILILK